MRVLHADCALPLLAHHVGPRQAVLEPHNRRGTRTLTDVPNLCRARLGHCHVAVPPRAQDIAAVAAGLDAVPVQRLGKVDFGQDMALAQ